MKSQSRLIMCFVCAIFFIKCNSCKNELVVYQTVYFKSGQSFELHIDDNKLISRNFEDGFQSNDYDVIGKYCMEKDTIKFKFILDGRDTTFFVPRSATRRLLVGSDINGNFSVATDEDYQSWKKM